MSLHAPCSRVSEQKSTEGNTIPFKVMSEMEFSHVVPLQSDALTCSTKKAHGDIEQEDMHYLLHSGSRLLLGRHSLPKSSSLSLHAHRRPRMMLMLSGCGGRDQYPRQLHWGQMMVSIQRCGRSAHSTPASAATSAQQLQHSAHESGPPGWWCWWWSGAGGGAADDDHNGVSGGDDDVRRHGC